MESSDEIWNKLRGIRWIVDVMKLLHVGQQKGLSWSLCQDNMKQMGRAQFPQTYNYFTKILKYRLHWVKNCDFVWVIFVDLSNIDS